MLESGELDEKVVSSILEHTTQHGAIEGKTQTKQVKYYNLDAIQNRCLIQLYGTAIHANHSTTGLLSIMIS